MQAVNLQVSDLAETLTAVEQKQSFRRVLIKGVLKICSKFTGQHPCRNVIPIKFLCNVIEITLRHGCSPVNLVHIFITPPKIISGGLLLV